MAKLAPAMDEDLIDYWVVRPSAFKVVYLIIFLATLYQVVYDSFTSFNTATTGAVIGNQNQDAIRIILVCFGVAIALHLIRLYLSLESLEVDQEGYDLYVKPLPCPGGRRLEFLSRMAIIGVVSLKAAPFSLMAATFVQSLLSRETPLDTPTSLPLGFTSLQSVAQYMLLLYLALLFWDLVGFCFCTPSGIYPARKPEMMYFVPSVTGFVSAILLLYICRIPGGEGEHALWVVSIASGYFVAVFFCVLWDIVSGRSAYWASLRANWYALSHGPGLEENYWHIATPWKFSQVRRPKAVISGIPWPKVVGARVGLVSKGKSKVVSRRQTVLSQRDYEKILKVMLDTGDVLENVGQSSATAFRNQILVELSSRLMTRSPVASFRATGRTGILLAGGGGDIFIAECTVWSGEGSYLEVVSSLLKGRLLAGVSIAIVVFSRNKDFRGVRDKVRSGAAECDGFLRWRDLGLVNALCAIHTLEGGDGLEIQITTVLVDLGTRLSKRK